jgi:hypothetical protein
MTHRSIWVIYVVLNYSCRFTLTQMFSINSSVGITRPPQNRSFGGDEEKFSRREMSPPNVAPGYRPWAYVSVITYTCTLYRGCFISASDPLARLHGARYKFYD